MRREQCVEFGRGLAEQRQSRALSLADVARVTKIPARSLDLLEGGRFEDLPGDVFVRGFLRSYARCVGLDAEELLRRYGELTTASASRRGAASGKTMAAGSSPPMVAEDDDLADETEVAPAEAAAPPAKASEPVADMTLLSKALLDVGKTRRVSLTLAVIILVIVATLTLSLLLRRPSRTGDGLSAAPAMGDTLAS